MLSTIETLCLEKGIRITDQRRVILKVLSESADHPDVAVLFDRVRAVDPNVSIATLYRTLRLLEEQNILEKHDFGQGRFHYEEASDEHHDHLIDIESGQVIEFFNHEIEEMKAKIARSLGYELIGHKLELYGRKIKKTNNNG